MLQALRTRGSLLISALVAAVTHPVRTAQTATALATTATAPVAQKLAEALPPAIAAVVLTLSDFFNSAGSFRYREVFKYNNISVRNLINRKAVLRALKDSTKGEFMAVPFPQRRMLFAFLKQETARYYGTAKRQSTSPMGKVGEPLPKLVFPTRQDAAAYRALLQEAERTLRVHIQPVDAHQTHPAAASST